MKSGHLSPETVDGWLRGALTPAQRLAVAIHCGACAACRQLALKATDAERLAGALHDLGTHPEFEELEALVDAKTDQLERDRLNLHFARCTTCEAEYQDLKNLRSAGKIQPALAWYWGIAAAAAAAIALFFIVSKPAKPPAPPVVTTLVKSVHDGNLVVGLDQSGGLRGLPRATPRQIDRVRSALQSGRLPAFPEAYKDLRRGPDVLLGKSAKNGGRAANLQPVGTVVPDTRPAFMWEAPPGAGKFIVSVYTTAFEPVIKSGELATPEWKPDHPLQAGTTYLWTVTVLVAGKRVTFPRSPAPDAHFRVATATERRQLEAVEVASPHSDLLEAVTAAELGMMDTAQSALRRLRNANLNSPLIESLAQSLK